MPSPTPSTHTTGEHATADLFEAADTSRLVSIVVRSMDRPSLGRALASVAAQTWPSIEVLVVSAKGPGHHPVGEKCGPHDMRMVGGSAPLARSAAANAGIAAANGEWICFLDDDDWLAPTHIEILARQFLQSPGAVAAYSGVSCVEQDAASGEMREVMRYNEQFDAARLLCENYLPIHSVLFSRAAATRTAGFDEALSIFEDWDFWIQLSRTGSFVHVDSISATYLLGSGDSGLYGNTALQEEFARRILDKWLPAISPAEWAQIWALCRRGLRAQDAAAQLQQAREDALAAVSRALRAEADAQAQREQAEIWKQDAAAAREATDRMFVMATEAERLREEAALSLMRQGDALQVVTREYHEAVALLQAEQYTVMRPLARNIKRFARTVWRRLPSPVQAAVRKVLGRPAAVGTPAPPAIVPGNGDAHDWAHSLAGGKPGAFTVILFPVIDWHFRIQRPQHLARELGKQGHRVLYLSTTFAAGSTPSDTRLIESPAENVHLIQLAIDGPAPNIYEDSLTPAQALQLAESLTWLQQAAGLGQLVSLVNLPFWRPVATRLPANIVAYDCMDFHAGFSTNTGTMLGEEEALLRDCDLLITTSGRLAELMQAQAPGKPHALVRNGTQVEHFATPPAELRLQPDGRPVIGYFGAISEWFDMGLVVDIARARPDWRFILVGSTFGCDVSQARRMPNIEFIGEVPYAELPGWVHAFDVCLIPFIINELTSCTNPVKVYEYLSAGKQVVATRMPELVAIADQVRLADDAPGFVQQIEQALQADSDPTARIEAAAARRTWASNHSWEARGALLSQAIAASFPKVSVIVLCYNNLELTKACLHSVEHNSLWPNLELVVVDNASSDGSPAWLTQFAATRPWVKLILSAKNTGFAAGNNLGLAAATGELLIMLNNDTEVSPGWIQGLRRHFDREPKLGMVGPVTDNIGNEAKIAVGYSDPAGMAAWAMSRTVRHAGEQIHSRVLAFFCVALRRTVYEEVGGLDEAFGLGFFEDDDYCNRARQAGWQLAIAEDVFVHHHLSASFDKLKSSTRQELFEKNKAIYERKWGPWVPHVYREAGTSE
ncbi:glycosyltransferase [Caenimonas koreensis]|uniref:glycosyltransferase n=1 Tax=Caenimonas koreensis TaxID=367474 RepID=UPI003782DFCA